jgi:hypothetical protein
MSDKRYIREQLAQQPPPLKRRATADQYAQMARLPVEPDTYEEEIVPDAYYSTRPPTSVRRYVDTRGNQVIQQGNKRIVIHDTPPPKRKVHWLLILGIGMALMLGLYLGATWLVNWWSNHQMDAAYGFPRIYQADAVIYPGDSAEHPSHYIFLNLAGTVEIIELPHGDSAHARIYKGPQLFSDNASLVPVTGEFRNVNGKVEMLVHIQDKVIVYINDGSQFKPQ